MKKSYDFDNQTLSRSQNLLQDQAHVKSYALKCNDGAY